jgi:PAS domain S-box-containing protein
MNEENIVSSSREFAESIINTVREPLIALDQDLRVVSASRSFYEFFQVRPEETVGQLIYDLGNKQWDIPKLRELLETILPQKTSFDNYEVDHVFATIGRRTMLLNARQIERAWGKERIILLAIEDISERKEIEAGRETTRKELAVIKKSADAAYEFAESVINTVREPLISLDQDLRVVTVSRSFYEFFKVKPEETVGQLIYDLGNKQWDIPKLRELLETILPQQTSFDNYEVNHVFTTIGRRTMLLNARQIERAWGKERIILLAIEDITERKEIEAGLETTRKELAVIKKSADAAHEFAESVINTVREPLISLDHDLRVVTVSRSFYEFFLVKPEDTVGQLIYDLGNKQWDIPKLRELLETILPQQTTFDNYEVDHVFTTLGRRIMLLNARQIERAWGKERIILLAFEDITERRRLEDLLTESEERYRRLFETASDGIVLLEKKEGHIAHANPAVEEMLGYSETECLGKKLHDIGVSIGTHDFSSTMQALNRNGILNYEDVPVKTKSGQDIYTDIYMVDRAQLAQCNIRDVTERKKAENMLTEEKNKAQMYLDVAGVMILALDSRGRIKLTNKKGLEILGYQENEVIGQNWFDLCVPDTISEKVQEVFRKLMTGDVETVEYFENPIVTKGGEERILAFHNALLRNASGEISGIIFSGEDITERKNSEEYLKEERAFTENALNSLQDIFLVFDLEGEFLRWNKTLNTVTGYLDAEIAMMKPTDFFRNDDKRRIAEAIQTAVREGSVRVDALTVTKDGRQIPYSFSASLLRDAHGKPMGISGVARDITERKQAEQDLQAALVKAHEGAAKWEAIMASMGEGLSIQNSDYIITYQNQVLKELIGDHVGEHCYTAYEHNDQVCKGCPVEMVFSDGHVHNDERTVNIGKETLYREVTASPLRDIKGNIVAVIEIIRDVTEQKKLAAQLRQSQKMEAVGTLAGGIAHDFNNILNVIMGYGNMVMDTLAADSPAREDMHEVLVAADRAADLTKRLLVFSRKKVVDVTIVNINELILGLQKMLARIIRESIDFRLDLAARPLLVLADGGQLEQVLINLAANAKDAMKGGGRLVISTGLEEVDEADVAAYGYGKPGRYALITVADTGEGMDAETQKRIFEPFFTTKGVGEGTGLGLAISYGIIKQHNGYIKVYSEPGEGTAFKIYLPLREEAALAKKTADAGLVKGGNETILVAEDDAALRKLSRIVLESFGYTVITAEDGDDALAKFMENRERIGLVLLDMIMPKKNGKEVSEAIRKVCPGMKTLFASGYTMEIITNKELLKGDFDFIQKPYQSKGLLLKVREVLDR